MMNAIRMKELSRWARRNPIVARWLIALGHILVILNALISGVLFFLMNIGHPGLLLFIVANAFFLIYIFYPDKKGYGSKGLSFYYRQKAHDLGLVLTCWMVIALGVNGFLTSNSTTRTSQDIPEAQFIVYRSHPEKFKTPVERAIGAVKGWFRDTRVKVVRHVDEFRRSLKQRGLIDKPLVEKILLTILTLAVAAGVGIMVAGFSCNLACSGHTGLAWVVLIIGWGGIIWLGFIVLRNVYRDSNKISEPAS